MPVPDNFEEEHAALIYNEKLPLSPKDAAAAGYVCKHAGCAFNSRTEFSDGHHPDFGTVVKCPGCDSIFSTAGLPIAPETLEGVRSLLARPEFKMVPTLGPSFWETYTCTQRTRVCLWRKEVGLAVENRLRAIRHCLEQTAHPRALRLGNPPPQIVRACSDLRNKRGGRQR
ncbi:hypothetical protein CDEST_00470 [Colletotrichum destructivum]|uniref:Uncharacterized protein n=1 Tax=Colletotrichum destructivum TaxID=34406 RepID=A0AAX4HWB1_9PEZI|nr:hypothetical protein CDEST_00470 [Colletotrichum destructivum]